MDLQKRESLVSRVLELGFANNGDQVVAVTPNEFFEGNDDISSLGRSLSPHPGLESLYYHLIRFEQENEVELYVAIFEVDEEDEDIWPSSNCVYIVGEVESSAIRSLLNDVMASGVDDIGNVEINGQTLSDVFCLWWE